MGQPKNLPPDYMQAIPRGAISSIDSPVFVTADEAQIAGDTWVFGVVVNGRARAYALNLLNHHEIVNDREGETEFSAVW